MAPAAPTPAVDVVPDVDSDVLSTDMARLAVPLFVQLVRFGADRASVELLASAVQTLANLGVVNAMRSHIVDTGGLEVVRDGQFALLPIQ
jgi:hypothetical protein